MENVKLFNNASIREHLSTCLSNEKLSKSQLCNEQKMGSHDTRQLSRQHKVEAKENVRLFVSNFSSYINNVIFQESPVSTSVISETEIDATSAKVSNSISNSCTSISSDNLWLTILNCHQSQDPPRALINASRSNFSPILTVLATCYEVLFYFD